MQRRAQGSRSLELPQGSELDPVEALDNRFSSFSLNVIRMLVARGGHFAFLHIQDSYFGSCLECVLCLPIRVCTPASSTFVATARWTSGSRGFEAAVAE